MVYLTFVSEFNAVHRLWSDVLDGSENLKLYGECANPAGHGHLYRVETTFAADVSRDRPVVMARSSIRELVDGILRPRLANADMNETFGVAGFVSTGENVTREIWNVLESHVPERTSLVCVRVIETPKNSFAYYGPGGAKPPMM